MLYHAGRHLPSTHSLVTSSPTPAYIRVLTQAKGVDLSPLHAYVDAFKYGAFPHAGGGMSGPMRPHSITIYLIMMRGRSWPPFPTIHSILIPSGIGMERFIFHFYIIFIRYRDGASRHALPGAAQHPQIVHVPARPEAPLAVRRA